MPEREPESYSERIGGFPRPCSGCGMKVMYKRSSLATALAEPEEISVSATGPTSPFEPGPTSPLEPAPAGALHRVYPPGKAAAALPEPDAYIPQRGSYGMRLRGGMPHGVAGRVLLGSSVFAALALVTLLIAGVHRYFLHDGRFLITTSSEIAIAGNEHISRAQVLSVFGADLERNIFKVPLAERRADLERLPWVAHATVMRLLPNHLRVEITERTPVAFTRQGTRIGLVDGDGVLLDMPPQAAGDPHYSFPVLTGLAIDDTPEVRAARMEVYRRFMTELTSAGPKVTESLSEVDVTNPEDVKALVTTGGADILVHFGDEAFLERYKAFEQHLPEWHTQYPKLASADMRYERQVVLEMQGSANAPASGEAAPAGIFGAGGVSAAPKAMPVAEQAHNAAHRAEPAKTATRAAADRRLHAKLAAAHRLAKSRARAGR